MVRLLTNYNNFEVQQERRGEIHTRHIYIYIHIVFLVNNTCSFHLRLFNLHITVFYRAERNTSISQRQSELFPASFKRIIRRCFDIYCLPVGTTLYNFLFITFTSNLFPLVRESDGNANQKMCPQCAFLSISFVVPVIRLFVHFTRKLPLALRRHRSSKEQINHFILSIYLSRAIYLGR